MKYCIQRDSEAILRECDSTHQDAAFFRRHFVAIGEKKKVKQKPVPYMHQDVTFFRRRFTAFDEKKKVMQELLPYTEDKRKRTVLPSWQTERLGYLQNGNKLCLA